MKVLVLISLVILVSNEIHGRYMGRNQFRLPERRCANIWDDGCNNGNIPGSGGDDDYLGGGGNPGKRCVNIWDDGCNNGSGGDDDYLEGSPGKRCANMWDDGCSNGGLPGAGGDGDYLGGGGTPGKRCANIWDDGCNNGNIPGSGGDDDYLGGGNSPGKRSMEHLMKQLMRNNKMGRH